MPKKKLKAPNIQDIREEFLSTHELAGHLLFHEGDKHFYQYKSGAWNMINDIEFEQTVEEFLICTYNTDYNINITTQLIHEVIKSLSREGRASHMVRCSADDVSSCTAFTDCTIDLSDLTQKVHDKNNLSFHSIPHPLPTKEIETPSFDKWLKTTYVDPKTFEPDEELITFILDSLAYYLTPINRKPFALIMQGAGGNGKSVLLDLLTLIMGTNFTCSLSLEDLSSRFGAADIAGKRLNIVSEDSAKLTDTSKIKALISQDLVSYERKFFDRTTFRPTAKHIISTNKDIRFESVDEATMRRIYVVPHHRLFRENGDLRINNRSICELNPSLLWNDRGVFKGKFVEELPGIIFKILKHLQKLIDQQYRIHIPKQLLDTKRKVQSVSSTALEYLHQSYTINLNLQNRIEKQEIYTNYLLWYEENGKSLRFRLQPQTFWSSVEKNLPEIMDAGTEYCTHLTRNTLI